MVSVKKMSWLRTLSCMIVLTFLCTPVSASDTSPSSPLSGLEKVGEARLSVWFWDIYDSALFTPSGDYQKTQFPQALKIDYLRDIEAKELIEQTEEEWQKLGESSEQYSAWLSSLSSIWPDIKEGDQLLLLVDAEQTSHFYFNGESVGQINDKAFGPAFLRIWLDPQCSYPKVRRKLIGEK